MAPQWPMMRFGKLEGGGPLTPEEQARVDSTFDDYLKLQELLDVTDGFTSLPNASMRDTFDRSLKQADDSISNIFFNTAPQTCIFGGTQYSNERNEVASCLMAKSISKTDDHNYCSAVNGDEAQSKWHEIVTGESGREMGNSLLTQDLIDNDNFQFYLDDPDKWLPMLESLFQDEVYITGTIVKELAMNVNLPGKMKFFVLQALGSTMIDVIADKWIECSSKDIVQPCLDFIRVDNHMDYIRAWLDDDPYYYDVRNACNVDTPDYGKDYIIHHYGESVVKWLDNQSIGPKKYGLSVNVSNVEWVVTEYPGGCFLPGTTVTGGQGNDVCIEDLQENDLILGRAGNVGVISSEKTGPTLKTGTPIFGFNDDEPFFLSSHPFWSQDGWRAINPLTAREENDWLEVGPLKVGDYVCKAKSINGNEIQYEWVKIERFRTKTYPAGTRLYGVHTREGPRSYHANKYLVMQNYPEITIQRVANRLSKLDKKNQQAVQKELKRMKPTLKRVLGDAVAEAVSSLASKRALQQLTKSSQKPTKKNALQSKEFSLPPLELKYESSNVSYGSYKMPTSVRVHRRQLFVDKKFVKEVYISNDKEVSWCRRVEDGLWEHGCLKVFHKKLLGSGFIALTKNKNDEEALLHAKLTAHFKVCVYNCDKSNEEVNPPDPDGKSRRARRKPRSSLTWYECGSFEMGFKYDPDSTLWAAVAIGKVEDRDDLGGCIKLDEDKDEHLTVDIPVPPKFAKYTEHIKMFGTFDAFYNTFNGYCTEYDPNAPGNCGKTYGWRGTYDSWEEYDNDELELARQDLLKSEMHSKANIGLSSCAGNRELKCNVSSKMVLLLRANFDKDLSLDDLFTLTGPDPTELHDRTFALMEKCMKYEMSDEDREAVLGDSKPILSGPEEAVAEAHKEFIGVRFAHCYLMNALSRNKDFDDRITDTQRNQLLYFFAGNEKDSGCMATDQDYRASNNDLARLAFIGLCPRVQDYIDDDGPGWAQKLYDYITTPDKLIQFAIMTEVDEDCTKIQKQAMVLYCLDPDKDLGIDFYNKVMMTKLQSNFDYFNGSEDVVDDMIDIIGDILKVLTDKILAGDDKELIGEIKDQCQKELQELQDEMDKYGEDLMTVMTDFVTQVIKDGGFTGDFWDRYFAAGKTILENMKPQIAAKAVRWLCGMVLPAIGFFFTIKAFANFDQLTPDQKAAVILDASSAALSIINKAGPKILDKFVECFAKGEGDFKFVVMFSDAESSGVTLTRLATLVEDGGSAAAGETLTVEEAIANSLAGADGDIAVIETRWSKAFKYVGDMAKLTGVIASFVGAISSGLKLFRDIKDGKKPSIIAFDAIETASFAMVGICEALSFTIECQALPIVGQVCAVIGLVASIILLFIHDPPDNRTPAQIYCDDRGGPYIDKLTIPTQDWLDNYHEQHPDDPDDPDS